MSLRERAHRAIGLCIFSAGLLLTSSVSADFIPIGDLPGGGFGSRALGISADGSTVVGEGSSAAGGRQAVRWTVNEGMTYLGSLSGGGGGTPNAASADGSVIGGVSAANAFQWQQSTGMQKVDSSSTRIMIEFGGISADGSVMAVTGRPNKNEPLQSAYRFVNGSPEFLGDLPGGLFVSFGEDVSADGSVVVGAGNASDMNWKPIRWTQSDGMENLGTLRGGAGSGWAHAVSGNGLVIVGESTPTVGSGKEAFRWTEAGGMVGLGDLDGSSFHSTYSIATDTSADGSVIVGRGDTDAGLEAFIWTESEGMRSLQELLQDAGLAVGWQLEEATGISADGNTIVGYGINPLGFKEGFVVTLPVPEPSSFALAFMGLACLAGLGARKRRHRIAG